MPAGGRSAGGASENAVGVESRNRHRRPPRRRRAWLSPSAPPAAPVRTASSLRTTERFAWGHAAVSAGAFAGRIAPLRVHDARATVRRSRTRRSRESASCSRCGLASQGIAMKPAAFGYQAPGTLREAIDLLASNPEAFLIAGGQSLMPVLAFRLATPSLLVDLRRLPGLGNIAVGDDGFRLGALVRWRDIEDDQRLVAAHPRLPRTSHTTRSATVARSGVASPMPTRRRNCPASR